MYASASMARLKAARRLTKRALRQRERAFLAEGPQAVSEALATGAHVTGLFVTAPAQARHADLVAQAEDAGVDVQMVSGEVMSELAQTVTPQGLLAVCDFVDVPLEAVTAAKPALVALLANVRDPGNAGTVLRAADAAGADAVIFADASVDVYNGKCVRASAGSLFHLPVVAGVRLPDTVAALKARPAGSRRRRPGEQHARRPADPGGAELARPRGCSATRRGGCPTTCSRSPTSRSPCRSTAARNRSTSPRRRRCACTPRPSRCSSSGGATPAPPMSAVAGLIARTAIASGPPQRTRAARIPASVTRVAPQAVRAVTFISVKHYDYIALRA